ncbi:MAG: metalloregulator ArsR/SmtB family transcription factor [Patescibacteria group bacterium]
MKYLEKTLKALANRRRLAILKYLKENKESSVGGIAYAIKLSFKATSKHLNILATMDILEKEQRSLQIFYRLSDDQKSVTQKVLSLL